MTTCSTNDIIGSQYFPFDDSQEIKYQPTTFETGGSDTMAIDPYRQGVEIRTNRHRFVGMQPKVWSGNLCHYTNVNTIGQSRNFTEYENSQIFEDLPEFDPVAYIILGINYPFPIVFNNGPQQEEEAIIEPITIPFRKNSNEGNQNAKRVYGSLEDGNNFQDFNRSSNRIEQFSPYESTEYRYFLDDGGEYIGNSNNINEKIIIPQNLSDAKGQLNTYSDTSMDDIIEEISYITNDMFDVLVNMNYNLNNDLRNYKSRSANAGFFIYGGNLNKYGTDSVTYLGKLRGT